MTHAATHATIKHVSDSTFDKDVINADTPVLVDFWAEWCGPCKMFAPVLDEIAREYDGKITIAKMDIDANPATPVKYGIRGIPTVILYKGGQAQAQKVGALSKSQLTAFLDSHL
jgi:thioredoxin 1